MPKASDCTTPGPSAGPGECISAKDAVAPLISSFAQYKITTAGEQAALLSWIALESDELKYNINHFPGTPGQGTRCMLSPAFVSKYVASLPDLAGKAGGADPAGTLKLVLDPQHSLGSAAWFLSSQCSADVRKGLQAGTQQGWEAFITGCVQTTVTDQRRQYWVKAKEALFVQ